MKRNDRKFEINAVGILDGQLMDPWYMHIADGEDRHRLVRILEKILQPFHRLRMEEQVGPLHILVSAPDPVLIGTGRFLADVVEDVIPILLGRLSRFQRIPIAMIDFIAECAFYRAGLADADRNFSLLHFFSQNVAVIRRMIGVDQPGVGRNDGDLGRHRSLLYPHRG